MSNKRAIANEVLDLANKALLKGEHWMAYNRSLYFADKENVQFFSIETDAIEFANNNISDRDSFYVILFDSIQDKLKSFRV